MKLHVGCAMWAHTAWQGSLLPHPLAPRERLRAYASWCNSVEGNTTFYATPSAATVESWAAQTAPDFRFLFKLPKPITHERRLTDTDAQVRAFVDVVAPLGPRVHALWIQLPASFGPSDLGSLAAFLHRAPREFRYAVEVRHPAFFEDPRWEGRLERVLDGVGAEWTSFDTTDLFAAPPTSAAEREAWEKKPRLPRRSRALTADPVVRYISRDNLQQSAESWHHWTATVADWLREGRSPTVFIHTPNNDEALTLARRFHDEVSALVPGLDPLPEPLPTGPPTLF
ncbi:DUF72 domain-containing protein [Streptacidiphilus sp. PB12-B1b]|uniref:DUF72 domain-containing protein n=1 Tax=Streptacidiphilus sp. PB12-B1b TaxID=2705012 RepID=UPI0015FABA6F|nr:DUF72 domain-containing protein [Streptacidiphilus sp. PB12-B1b]QMU79857.1 DUF72 domain-containing protein [Streptacidiphilus sp. PB12-B1b]